MDKHSTSNSYARNCTVTRAHSSSEAEYIAADTGARLLAWVATLGQEMKIPLAQQKVPTVEAKPSNEYHDGVESTKNQPALIQLIDNHGAIDMASPRANQMHKITWTFDTNT